MISLGSIQVRNGRTIEVRDKLRRIVETLTGDAILATRLATATSEVCRTFGSNSNARVVIEASGDTEEPAITLTFEDSRPIQRVEILGRFFDSTDEMTTNGASSVRVVKALRKSIHLSGDLIDRLQEIVASKSRDELMAEIQGKNLELEHNRGKLEEAAREAKSADRAKSQFLARMSHEIRTPMNGVLGMAELLLNADLRGEQRRAAELIRSSGEALLAILNDILDLSKIEAGQLELEEIPVDLNEVVDLAVRVLATMAAEKSSELVIDIRPDVPISVKTDPVRLRQVLTNLVSNAVKFTDGGQVVVRVSRMDDRGEQVRLRFSVRDTGIGIPEAKREDIFGEFAQADTSTTRRYGGTGLGLAICQRIVELMGGGLQVESEEGKGSDFFFEVWMDALHPEDAGPDAPSSSLEAKRFLVAGTKPLTRRITSEFLQWAGAEVATTDTYNETLRLIGSETDDEFDAVVVDHNDSDRSLEVIGEIRSRAPEQKLMILTSAVDHLNTAISDELGIDTIMTKPVTRFEFVTAVSDMIHGIDHARPGGSDTGAPDIRQLEILVADDNRVNQEVARAMLEGRGHSIDVVDNGQEAVDHIRAKRYDVVLMDVQMPVMDGFSATKQIRLMGGGYVDLPIVALTAHALQQERDRCLEAGMDDFLSKPFKPADLFELVERLGTDHKVAGGAAMDTDIEASGLSETEDRGKPPVALDEFRALMPNAVTVLDEILSLFLEEAPMRMTNIRTALEAGEPRQISAAAHALKSSARTIRADSLGALLEEMEQAGYRDETERAKSLAASVLEETERVCDYLRANL